MARASRKALGVEMEKIIDEEFSKFEEFLPSPQDVAVYRRKRREYLDAINARMREGGLDDGRDGEGAAAAGERDGFSGTGDSI